LSSEKVKAAAKAGLAAAATKAKLFADHEEREIQRLSANIINHQVELLPMLPSSLL
jgi:SWI/SNF related-matrix-associated actin-dependent regulator of chromatin subfamily C